MTISFRISETAFKALQEDAKRHNVSINTLANQLFVTYAEYDRYLSKFHMIKLSASTFKRILNAASEDEIAEAGSTAGTSVPVSFILAQKGDFTFENAVEYLRTMGTHANLFDFTESIGSSSTISNITLTHDLGLARQRIPCKLCGIDVQAAWEGVQDSQVSRCHHDKTGVGRETKGNGNPPRATQSTAVGTS